MPSWTIPRYGARINIYVGAAAGPPWAPHLLSIGNDDVVVVVVEPPRAGDGGWPLRREYDGARSGTLYVRKQGTYRSHCDAADIRHAQSTGAGSDDCSRCVPNLHRGSSRVSLFNSVMLEPELGRCATSMASEMLADAQRVRNEQQADRDLSLLGVNVSLGLFGTGGDDRTLQDFEAQVDKWRQEFATEFMSKSKPGDVRQLVNIGVENPTETYLPGGEVRVHIDVERCQCQRRSRAGLHPLAAPAIRDAVPASRLCRLDDPNECEFRSGGRPGSTTYLDRARFGHSRIRLRRSATERPDRIDRS